MLRNGLILIVAAQLSSIARAGEPPPVELPVAITNVTIVYASGEKLATGTILMRDGRIAAIGMDVELPPGTRVIDGTGHFAYPGFVDAFSRDGVTDPNFGADDERRVEDTAPSISDEPHVATPLANRHGVFARRSVERVLDIESDTFEDHRKAGFTAAALAPPRAILGGTASVVLLGDGPLRRTIVRRDIAQTAAFAVPGQRELKSRGNYPGTLLGVIAQMRQTLDDARWYLAAQDYKRRHAGDAYQVPFDQDLEQLGALLTDGQPMLFEANSADEIGRALNITAEFEVHPVIVGGQHAWQSVDSLKAAGAPVLVSLNLPKKPEKYSVDTAKLSKPIDDGTEFGKAWEKRSFYPEAAYDEAKAQRADVLENVQRLEEAGVPWGFTTLGLKDVSDGLSRVHDYIDAGLAPEAALKALTATPAEILGVADQVGELKVGLRANVTVLSGPLANKKSRVTQVVVAGDVYEFPETAKKDREWDKDKGHDRDPGKSHKAHKPKDPNDSSAEEANEPAGEHEAERDETEPAADQSAESQPAESQPADPLRTHEPDWPIETDKDRIPSFHTGGSVLLENAYVITVSGDDLEHASVLIENGKITAVGNILNAPAGIKRINLEGYVVMPGMFDPHSHLSLDAINEWTMSVTPEVRTRDVIRHDDPGMYWAVAGGVTAMHCMHGSANTIGGQNIILKNKYGKPTDELIMPDQPGSVKFALGENVKRPGMRENRRGRDAPLRFPGTRMGVEATLRRALQRGRDYLAQRTAYEKDVAAGRDVPPMRKDLRLEALADILTGDIWIQCHCYRSDEILRLLAVAEDFGIRVAGLHHVLEGYRIMPEILRHGCGTATFADWWAYKMEAYDAVPQNAGMMLKYGIDSAIKSDSGDLIRHMNMEAAKCMKYSDLTPNQALRLVTVNAARLFALDDRLGTIDVGKDGDIAVFNGHPLDSFSECVMTLIDGEVYFVHPDFDPEQPAKARPIKRFTHGGAEWKAAKGKTPLTINPKRGGPTAPPAGTTVFAIAGGTVHPISGPAIPDGVVIIRDGKIEAVGAGLAIPADAEQIDATGLQVWPGLIDAGTNVGMHEIDAVGVTNDTDEPGTFQPDLMAVSALNPNSAMIEVTRAEGITTALLVPNGPTIAGQGGAVDLNGWTMPEMLIDAKVGLVVSLPSERVEPIVPQQQRRRRSPWAEQGGDDDQTGRALKQIDDFFGNARRYAEAARDAAARHAALGFVSDPRYDAMEPYVLGEKPVLFRAETYKQILEALQFADAHELRPIIFGGRDAWKLADLLAERDVPLIYEGTFAMPSRIPGLGNVTDPWDGNYCALARLSAAGVRFCVAHRSADLAKLLGSEIGFAVGHGLDPDVAARAMTLSAAEILGIDDRYGSLDPGKVADVIVTTDHPAQASNRVRYLFIRGRWVSTESKHTRMAEKFANRPEPKLPPARTDLKGPPSRSFR